VTRRPTPPSSWTSSRSRRSPCPERLHFLGR
jgi:hypothetical protein